MWKPGQSWHDLPYNSKDIVLDNRSGEWLYSLNDVANDSSGAAFNTGANNSVASNLDVLGDNVPQVLEDSCDKGRWWAPQQVQVGKLMYTVLRTVK